MNISGMFPILQGPLLEDFKNSAERMMFNKGETLYENGFPCPFVPFVVSGQIRVFKISESGREIVLYRVLPGQICVMSSTCSISDREYTAIAETEADTVVYIVPAGDFRRLLKKYSALQEMILDILSQRLMDLMTVVEDVKLKRVDVRLASRLLNETNPPAKSVLTTTHAELAMELGSAREVISRILKDFERRGFVNLIRGRVEVISRRKLQDFHKAGQLGR